MTIKELLQKYNLTQTAFSRRFGIPLRSVQHWVCEGKEHRECPDYVVRMADEILQKDSQEIPINSQKR